MILFNIKFYIDKIDLFYFKTKYHNIYIYIDTHDIYK